MTTINVRFTNPCTERTAAICRRKNQAGKGGGGREKGQNWIHSCHWSKASHVRVPCRGFFPSQGNGCSAHVIITRTEHSPLLSAFRNARSATVSQFPECVHCLFLHHQSKQGILTQVSHKANTSHRCRSDCHAISECRYVHFPLSPKHWWN